MALSGPKPTLMKPQLLTTPHYRRRLDQNVMMLSLALALLSLAVLIGVAIGIRFLGDRRLPSRTIGAVQGF
jgi:hypothetical protein